MWPWIIIGAVVIVAAVILLVTLKLKKAKAKPEPEPDPEVEVGHEFKRLKRQQVAARAKLKKQLDQSTKKVDLLRGRVGEVGETLREDHEKISKADNWDELDDAVDDIEGRK